MNDELREALAAYAHTAWSGWMAYLFEKAFINNDGSITIPKDSYDRWRRQAATTYAELPEQEKESDRDEADKMIGIVLAITATAPLLKPKPPQKPSVGCVVHYVMESGKCIGAHRPALIVHVHNQATVNLSVATDGPNDYGENGPARFWIGAVDYDETGTKPRTWHWQESVG